MRLAVAALWALVVAVGLYGPVRFLQYLIFPEADPATIIWSPHAGFLWRVLTVGYAGGMVGFVAYVLSRDLEHASRLALRALPLATALLVVQSLFVP